jgi:RNA polymerase sigma factor for flagellar operon FliA
MTAEQMYLENLETIERIASFVAHRNHLNADETREFVQEVKVRLFDNDYAIIRKFEGRSSFSTYLTTVIARLYQQWRTELLGKWRPSAEAKRLGDKAIVLERYLTRDGYSFSEAVSILTTPASSQYTVCELEAICVRLPPRNPRPTLVSDEMTPEGMIAVDADADDRVEMHERECVARKIAQAVDRLIAKMDPENCVILQLRFWQALTAPQIALRLQMEQKKVYKRLDKLFEAMRRELEAAGITKADIEELLSRGDQEIRFEFPHDGEIRPFGPSHQRGGKKARGGDEGGSQ